MNYSLTECVLCHAMQNQRSKSRCSSVFYHHLQFAVWEKKKDSDVFFWGGGFLALVSEFSSSAMCFFFCVTLHKLLMSGGLVWNKYVCVSTGSALLSDIALGHSSISLSLSLCLSVCLKGGGGGVGEVYIELQTADSPWNLYCAKSTIWGHPITYLTLLWHSTQLLYELSKDSYWEQNEVGIGQCRGVCLYLRQCTADAVHQNKKKMAHRDAN